MTEKLLQYIWQFQYFNRSDLVTTRGEGVEIIFPGTKNNNQGPDFLAARIKIGNTLLAGSVELHLKTSEWKAHGHEEDENYKNVILHVVLHDDAPGLNNLPVLELHHRIPKLLLYKYETLMQQQAFVPCAATIAQVSELTWQSWKERLAAERLTRKSKRILDVLQRSGNHWEETFWQLLARNFGTKVNADAFENIAQTLPLRLFAKHKQSIQQLEALLFGQANLLPKEPADDYTKLLVREYGFLKTKYNLQPAAIPVHFLRMRPPNFPTLRLAQLAALVQQSEHLFSKIVEAKNVANVKQWLAVTANDYWHYHYRFGEPTAYKPKTIGDNMIDNIIINTVVPTLFAYGLYHQKEELKEKAIEWLQATAAESNYITKGFKDVSVANASAFDSQALIELKNEYCHYRRCLDCAVGNAVLKKWNTL